VKTRFQKFSFKRNLYRYILGREMYTDVYPGGVGGNVSVAAPAAEGKRIKVLGERRWFFDDQYWADISSMDVLVSTGVTTGVSSGVTGGSSMAAAALGSTGGSGGLVDWRGAASLLLSNGDHIQHTCVFDSTGRSGDTAVGPGTMDEMCWG
jgi:hypothetical protein